MFIPSYELGLPHPLSHKRLSPPPPPNLKWEGTHSPAGEGVVGSQFGRLEKKSSTLSSLWIQQPLIKT